MILIEINSGKEVRIDPEAGRRLLEKNKADRARGITANHWQEKPKKEEDAGSAIRKIHTRKKAEKGATE